MTSPPPPDPPGPATPAPPGQPPAGPPAGQPYQPQAYYPVPRRTNTLAILALVFAFVFSPAAIVLGHLARKQIRETGEEGDGLATAGLILGYVLTGLTVLFCVGYLVFFVVFLGAMGATGSM
jgi:hypothetical protein